MAQKQPDISIILVNYNTSHLFERLFASIDAAKDGLRLQIIAIDNGSRDDSLQELRTKFPHVEVVENTNVGFARGNNQALPLATGKYILLLNTDAFMAEDALTKSVAHLESHPRCGILGASLIGEDGTAQPSSRRFPTPWNIFLLRTGLFRLVPNVPMIDSGRLETHCDWVPGCYYFIRRELIDQIGLFDPDFFLYYEEVDHCRRAKAAGWEVNCLTDTKVIHIGGESAQSLNKRMHAGRQVSDLHIESEMIYFRKHFGLAGMLAGCALSILGDAYIAAKDVVRGRFSFSKELTFHLVVPALARTAFGTKPSR